MKKAIPISLIALMLCGAAALADDPKPAAEPAVAPAAAPAADAPKADDPVGDAEKKIDEAIKKIEEDPAGQVSLLIELAKSGRWGPFAGLLILILVWVTRKWVWKVIPANVLPWLTLGLAMLVSVAVGFSAGNVWWQVLLDGLLTGGSAMALWSMVFKHFMGPKKKKDA